MASNGHVAIPDIVIGRLPIYLRALNRLAEEGQEITSSHELGQRLGISSAQIRKDLSHFGGFGKQGTGYQIEYLQEKLRKVLNVDQEWEVALIGIGDLGKAIAHYRGFSDRGFRIACLFDSAPDKVGQVIGDYTVQPMEDLQATIQAKNIRLAMVAVPAQYAQDVANILVDAGIKGILNYAPINLTVPPGVQVQYIDPVVGLQRMTFYLDE
jgi:redox-sensing transcriptional repressor